MKALLARGTRLPVRNKRFCTKGDQVSNLLLITHTYARTHARTHTLSLSHSRARSLARSLYRGRCAPSEVILLAVCAVYLILGRRASSGTGLCIEYIFVGTTPVKPTLNQFRTRRKVCIPSFAVDSLLQTTRTAMTDFTVPERNGLKQNSS